MASQPAEVRQAAATSNILTILLLGIDQRPDEAAKHIPSRTDTMIVAMADATAKRAALVSIPRDLVVAIPGHGNQKINTAHFWGESDHSGGGPALAARTVGATFGVPVDYFARVDFAAFRQGIDALGGIVVDVDRPILDNEYPTEDYGIKRLYIPGGLQPMNGERALEYVRSRHDDNDFGRQSRQRRVILAAKDKLLRPRTILSLPGLVDIVRKSVATDVPTAKLPGLLYLALSIPPANVTNAGITYDMLVDVNKDGSEFLPDRAKIQHLFDTVLGAPVDRATPTSSAASSAPIQVEVLNGTTRAGFAAATADILKSKGYQIARVAQATTSDHLHTSIVDRSGSRQAGLAIAQAIGVTPSAVVAAPAQAATPDVSIVLGYDAPGAAGR
jgi:LCP family protein required for cell wall assembly